jgi:predicted DNA-binding transcriptional regulator AlpA
MLLNRATVCALTGLSAGSLYRRMKAGLFPPQVIYRPLKIRGWRREDIDKWLGLRWELEPEAAVAAFARSGLPTARTTLHARYAAVRLHLPALWLLAPRGPAEAHRRGVGRRAADTPAQDCGHCGARRIGMVVEAKHTGPRPAAPPGA